MKRILTLFTLLLSFCLARAAEDEKPQLPAKGASVVFNTRTARSGSWSDAKTWADGRKPKAGDFVQVRAGHSVIYDVDSNDALRMVHVAGTLTFSREKSTLLDVGLIKIEPGETTTEDGFNCHDETPALPADGAVPVLEIGTPSSPIPAGVKATIRLRHFNGTNPETLPAIIVCGGRWDVHGAPLKRTWVKLAAPAKAGDTLVKLEQRMSDWRAGDRIIITTGAPQGGPESGHTFQKRPFARQKPVGTEERTIKAVNGETFADDVIELDRPLDKPHHGEGLMRCEVANLSRNVVIESANPAGVRGHTMYHHGSSGGISYAEFRYLGKEGLLGKYPIHFHLVRETMRGSGVLGASIWDSHNRWVTIHGTDHLLVRDCVGYQSRGHGFFLEDATEQWNVLDRNLAVQAFSSVPLPKQVLSYDPNDGAGFWWANGRNTFTRNVACENDRYGYHFQITKTPNFNPTRRLRGPDGKDADQDVRALPFMRFEDNESHGDGLFAFRFGDEAPGSVRGDRKHPFIARNLSTWETHYAIRPNVQFFLLEGLRVKNAAFGIYHPDYDAHVYRDIEFDNIKAEPINGGHDEESLPYGDFTYDRLTFKNCVLGRDPLVQLTGVASKPGLAGHFRGVTLTKSKSNEGVVDFGGGPRTNKVDNPVSYFFHDTPTAGTVTRVVHAKVLDAMKDASYRGVGGWTGGDARAAEVKGIPFPQLLDPIDDLPPATLITGVKVEGGQRLVRGVAHDNGEIASVTVNGRAATIVAQHAGVADWVVTLDAPADGRFLASATDRAGNVERLPHAAGDALAKAEPPFRIQLDTITRGYDGKPYDGKMCYTQARAGIVPRKDRDPLVVVTMSPLKLSGSDVYFAMHEMRSGDLGQSWLGPFKHTDTLGRRPDGKKGDSPVEAVVCDFWPKWHAKSGKLLGTGQSMRFVNDKAPISGGRRDTTFSVYDADKNTWSKWETLAFPEGKLQYACGAGCTQRVDLPNGDILLPVYYRQEGNPIAQCKVLRCGFDGSKLTLLEEGKALSLDTKRGLGEPSLARFKGKFYLTIRHDDAGYVAVSDDGLRFGDIKKWTWDDGSALGTYNTQSHWVTHSDALYLVYTRRGASNDHIFRHRAPLFIAEVDVEKLHVKKVTEQVLIPEKGARFGNFGVCNVSENETWIVETEWMQRPPQEPILPVDNKWGAEARVYAARIIWKKPNKEWDKH